MTPPWRNSGRLAAATIAVFTSTSASAAEPAAPDHGERACAMASDGGNLVIRASTPDCVKGLSTALKSAIQEMNKPKTRAGSRSLSEIGHSTRKLRQLAELNRGQVSGK